MRIRTALRALSTVSALTLAALIISMFLSVLWLRNAVAFEHFLIDLQRNQTERTMLRDDILLTRGSAAFGQWQEKTREVRSHLAELSGKSMDSEGRLILARVLRTFHATEVLLPRILALPPAYGSDLLPRSGILPLQQRLSGQLTLNAYLLSDSIYILLAEARRETIHARNLMLFLLGLFTLLLAGTIMATTLYLSQKVSHGILELEKGTELVTQGNLGYRIPVSGDNELADLSVKFNTMSERLDLSYQAQESANRELEGFTYSVSHDLRTPLRHLVSYSNLLQGQNLESLDGKSRHYLDVISASAVRMGRLIDDLLDFSRMGRTEMRKGSVKLAEVVRAAIKDLETMATGREVQWLVTELPTVVGDEAMLRLVLDNLLGNALKFTSRRTQAVIEVGGRLERDGFVIYVRDNGAGFDSAYADKLFGLFQRLHRAEEFEGTGVGLANVKRIINRHGGRTWAEGEVDHGATFYFSLPQA